MLDAYKKYLLIKYAADTGLDDGPDYTRKCGAITSARRLIRDGWTTIACINTRIPRIEFVIGEPRDVYDWFVPVCADILRSNAKED